MVCSYEFLGSPLEIRGLAAGSGRLAAGSYESFLKMIRGLAAGSPLETQALQEAHCLNLESDSFIGHPLGTLSLMLLGTLNESDSEAL